MIGIGMDSFKFYMTVYYREYISPCHTRLDVYEHYSNACRRHGVKLHNYIIRKQIVMFHTLS